LLLLRGPALLGRRSLRRTLRAAWLSIALLGRRLPLALLLLLLLLVGRLILVALRLREASRGREACAEDEAGRNEALCGFHASGGFLVKRHEGDSGP
jgi:hypothetical protein